MEVRMFYNHKFHVHLGYPRSEIVIDSSYKYRSGWESNPQPETPRPIA